MYISTNIHTRIYIYILSLTHTLVHTRAREGRENMDLCKKLILTTNPIGRQLSNSTQARSPLAWNQSSQVCHLYSIIAWQWRAQKKATVQIRKKKKRDLKQSSSLLLLFSFCFRKRFRGIIGKGKKENRGRQLCGRWQRGEWVPPFLCSHGCWPHYFRHVCRTLKQSIKEIITSYFIDQRRLSVHDQI